MNDKQKAEKAVSLLEKEYPEAICSLTYKDPFQLLVATRLAAQCTDARVNLVTPDLFRKFPNIHAFANAEPKDIEECIKSCGLYKTKARDLSLMSKMLLEKFDGKVPDTIEELIRLPGVGRKTANLILGDIFNKPAVVVDTHCIRLTARIGFHNSKNPLTIEKILLKLLPKEKSNDFCHRLVIHGRAVCKARKPDCPKCCLKNICDYFNNTKN